MTHPADAPYPVTSLLDLGIDLGADIVWEALCSALAQQRQIYRAHGFEPVREAWNVRAQGIGRLVSVSPPHGKPLPRPVSRHRYRWRIAGGIAGGPDAGHPYR
jgi:biotin-(acetyl-CoA carboxylase) ligase